MTKNHYTNKINSVKTNLVLEFIYRVTCPISKEINFLNVIKSCDVDSQHSGNIIASDLIQKL